MTKRIDHATEAVDNIRYADEAFELGGDSDIAKAIAAVAQVHATLALVEQQRLANVIALSTSSYGGALAQAASDALWTFTEDDQWSGTVVIRPDVREALGL